MRLMMLATVAVMLCGGCAGRLAPGEAFEYPPELIDGSAMFGTPVPAAQALELLRVSPEMEAFVGRDITVSPFGYSRFRRLMTKMVEEGFFIDQYDRSATFDAARTFDERRGNCLAYTTMFVVLARLAGLDATYQIVQTRPSWDVESGFLVRNNHVNVLLEHIDIPGHYPSELTVDFNDVQPEPDTRRHAISDEYAASMFYGNMAIDRLHLGDDRGTFAYLKRAILTEPRNIDLWNNLGTLYSLHAQYALAQASYETAMQLDKRDKTAVSGLAKSLRQQGRLEEAEGWAKLAQKYQRRNPYYHYALAEQAYRNELFEEALAAVNQAIQLKRNNARFYALRAATAEELGDHAPAAESEKLQRKYRRGKAGVFNPRATVN